ncbi:hypothetical protein JOB18_005914 [Solea senegalensis]|uniref:EF-hand domain-containing protein n=1 Tax=Solea senegalensis TaxID=28829 RepID=A0AAV6QRQ9_SOLSE|nr:hypothetical protein JOB18_005914 [Solea senegalensis]
MSKLMDLDRDSLVNFQEFVVFVATLTCLSCETKSSECENSAISVGVHDTRCYRSGFQSLSSERQRERTSRSPFAAPLYFRPRQVVPVK